MKRTLQSATCLAAIVILVTLGCESRRGPNSAPVTFVTKTTPIAFTFPGGWFENMEQHPFDLQCFSPTRSLNTGVFAYRREDIREDLTPLGVLWESVEDLKSKRGGFTELRPLQKLEQDDKTITSIAYSGERDSSQYYYRFSLVEFKSDTSRFALLLQVAHPNGWAAGESVLADVVQSATLRPDVPNAKAQIPSIENTAE